MERCFRGRCRGFTLVELAAVVGIAVSVGTVAAPMLDRSRSTVQGMSSEQNLRTIGRFSGMYAQDNGGAIFTYTWQPGVPYVNLRNGNPVVPGDEQIASSYELRDILYRATGRLEGIDRIRASTLRLMQRRYSHLVLADYLGGIVSDEMWVDPADGLQLGWQSDPLGYLDGCDSENPVPYSCDPMPGSDTNFGWDELALRQLWTFGSSYQIVPAAYLFDDRATYVPNTETPHLFLTAPGMGSQDDLVTQRYFHEVGFAHAKVMMFEEFDRDQGDPLYFANEFARSAKLMFDGSVNTFASGAARRASYPVSSLVVPGEGRRDPQPFFQRYVPLDRFPDQPEVGKADEDQRYRWTYQGLLGLDYVQTYSGYGVR